jgi:hypothetical protein
MSLQRLRNWLFSGSSTRPRRASATTAGTRFRPALEVLEDRWVPSHFSVVGTTLLVTGTTGVDSFSFAPKGNDYLCKMDGESYTVNPAVIHSIVVDCKGPSADSAQLTVGAGSASLVLSPGGGTLTGANYKVALKNTGCIQVFGNASDSATLNASPTTAADFNGSPTQSVLDGSGYWFGVYNFGKVTVVGHKQLDTASMYGETGQQNVFIGTPAWSNLKGPGNNYSIVLEGLDNGQPSIGFAKVDVHAASTADMAHISGESSSSDKFLGTSTLSKLWGTGYSLNIHNFNDVVGFNVGGGTADLYDSAGGASFTGGPGWGKFSYADGATVEAYDFQAVTGHAAWGTHDSAHLYTDPNRANSLFATTSGLWLGTNKAQLHLDMMNAGWGQIIATTTSAYTDQAYVENGNPYPQLAIELAFLPYKLSLDGQWAGYAQTWAP